MTPSVCILAQFWGARHGEYNDGRFPKQYRERSSGQCMPSEGFYSRLPIVPRKTQRFGGEVRQDNMLYAAEYAGS
jgi:hypothetical protein